MNRNKCKQKTQQLTIMLFNYIDKFITYFDIRIRTINLKYAKMCFTRSGSDKIIYIAIVCKLGR